MRPSRVLALILVVLAFPASLWAQDVIYGCVKNNNGQMRIVVAGEKCLPSERPIQWAASADATVPASKPGATQGPLKVVDQNGTVLGFLVSGSNRSNAARFVEDSWLAFPLTRTGFFVTDPAAFTAFYLADDCSGDLYLPVEIDNLLLTGIVMPDSAGKLTFSFAGKPEADRTAIKGYGYYSGGVWTCAPYTPPAWAAPLYGKVSVIDLSSFTAPFKIVQ